MFLVVTCYATDVFQLLAVCRGQTHLDLCSFCLDGKADPLSSILCLYDIFLAFSFNGSILTVEM